MRRARPGFVRLASLLLLLFAGYGAPAFAQRTQLKPPWNIYSPQTDIQVGKQNAQLMMQKLPLCNDPKVDQYLTNLGMKLVSKLDQRGVTYPWEFHCVNDKSINAFALPGGYVFVNRGAIESADNESQLAAVMGHELSHVTLRHGTAQATKAQFAQGAAGIFGGIFGGSTGGALLTQGVALGAGGLLLRYSRGDETQADVSGTQVLYDTGYDPRAMSQFFEKLEGEAKGNNPPQFLSDHPNPGNRVERVNEEIDKLGGVPPNAKRDSTEFESIKREVLALPSPKKMVPAPAGAAATPPPPASTHFADYKASAFTLSYPDNWGVSESDGGAAFAPTGGVVQGTDGQAALAYGLIVNVRAEQGSSDSSALANATQRLISDLQKSNPNMKIMQRASSVRLNGQPGLSTYLSNDSPAGGQETDWLITVMQPRGLMSFLCVAPQAKYSDYDKTFSAILDTVRINR
ncbi:MAG TPA: M48 family metallopeptidase [Candidatus Sulfotelmatobacter sp.]|nr:M48 family metallopeptidase [Candidatus Sulfotelmatobacter sp.]